MKIRDFLGLSIELGALCIVMLTLVDVADGPVVVVEDNKIILFLEIILSGYGIGYVVNEIHEKFFGGERDRSGGTGL